MNGLHERISFSVAELIGTDHDHAVFDEKCAEDDKEQGAPLEDALVESRRKRGAVAPDEVGEAHAHSDQHQIKSANEGGRSEHTVTSVGLDQVGGARSAPKQVGVGVEEVDNHGLEERYETAVVVGTAARTQGGEVDLPPTGVTPATYAQPHDVAAADDAQPAEDAVRQTADEERGRRDDGRVGE